MYTHNELEILLELSRNVARLADAQERTAKVLEQLVKNNDELRYQEIDREISKKIQEASLSNIDVFI